MYTGIIVLQKNLDKKKYEHFLTLHVAVRILLSDTLLPTMTDYAEELLTYFVVSSKLIYGPQILSHNFHNLLHLTDYAREYGNLNLFSNFSSENYLQKIKKLLRTHNNVLSQIVKWISEEKSLLQISPTIKIKPGSFKLEKIHNGILINDTTDPQYKQVIFSNFKLCLNLQESCCKLKCGAIIEISNFAYCQTLKQVVIIGLKYNNIPEFYTKPCSSSIVGIHVVNELSKCYSYWSLSEVYQILVCLPFDSIVETPPVIDNEATINTSLLTTKNCFDSGTNKA